MTEEKNSLIEEEVLNNEEAVDETVTCEEDNQQDVQADETTVDEQLLIELDEKQKEVDELKNKYLRLSAEFDNYRKRTLKEKAELIKNGAEKTLIAILPILDDFERALKNLEVSEETKSMYEGVELIFNKFIKVLNQEGLQVIETKDKEFDTDYCEAIALVPTPSDDMKGKILDCVQTGYMLNDKVIRHSKVVVAQ